jgi:hypothetical protein
MKCSINISGMNDSLWEGYIIKEEVKKYMEEMYSS